MSSNTKPPTTPSSDWERFKEQRNKERESGWKSLMDAFHKQSYQQRERFYSYHYKKKVDESLWSVGNFELANRIENCGIHPKNKGVPNSNPVCKSPWCLGCRNRLYQRYYHKVRERLDHGKHQLKYFETLTPPLNLTEIHEGYEQSQYTNEDIRQINGVAGICGFNIDAVQHTIEEDYKRWRRIRRRLNKITGEVVWIEAVYELELVDWRKLKKSTFKRSRDKIKQMEQLIEHAGKEVLWEQNYFEYEPFVFVHWHGLTNLTREQQIEVFKNDYFVDGKKEVIATIDKLELDREKLQVERDETINIANETVKGKRWKDWVSTFKNKIGDVKNMEVGEELREFFTQIIDKIVVVRDGEKVVLDVHFQLPFVEDGLVYKDLNDKSLGYNIIDGKSNYLLEYRGKKNG